MSKAKGDLKLVFFNLNLWTLKIIDHCKSIDTAELYNSLFNPFMPNEISHLYQLDEPISNLLVVV